MAARKKTTPKKKAAAKAPAKKKAAKAPAKKKAAAGAPAKKAPAKKASGGVSSLQVNLGHIFALRPRVETSFRPDDLRVARQQLQDESYASLPEAARAVAEKALDIAHGTGLGPDGRGRKGRH